VGRAAWPELDIPLDELARHLARVSPEHETPPVERAADLYLALACALRQPRALAAFDRILVRCVARGTYGIDRSPAFADVVAQDLRTRLLLGARPKIADYAGRASLETWLKTAAVRAALNLRRTKREDPHDSVCAELVGDAAPDLDVVRARYRIEFEAAVRAALLALSARERDMLCATVRDRLTMEALAARYGVGRATAVRWLAAARETLTRDTRRRLEERLGLTRAELDSVAAALRSRLDVSIVRLLEEA
jgi:RNA polymerase sigma-70 factor (ECF subfamily)